MDRSPSSTVSPGLQIVFITAVAATLGVVAGGVLVSLQQRQSGIEPHRRRKSALNSSRSDSSSIPVPLFDSVQVGFKCGTECGPQNEDDQAKQRWDMSLQQRVCCCVCCRVGCRRSPRGDRQAPIS